MGPRCSARCGAATPTSTAKQRATKGNWQPPGKITGLVTDGTGQSANKGKTNQPPQFFPLCRILLQQTQADLDGLTKSPSNFPDFPLQSIDPHRPLWRGLDRVLFLYRRPLSVPVGPLIDCFAAPANSID